MLNYLLTALSLLFWYSPDTAPDAVFSSAFEEQMHISTDRPAITSWALTSTPSNNAAFVTSQNYLVDGKVSIPTRISWDTGTQSIARSVAVSATSSNSILIKKDAIAVVAVLCPKTAYAVPEGVNITLAIDDNSLHIDIAVFTNFVTFDDGSTGIIAILVNDSGSDMHADSVTFRIFNDLNGATWATAGQQFDIGELWFGTLQEFNIATDPKRKIMGGPTERRSHNNTDQPLFQKSYYQWTFNFTPMNDTAAFDSSTTPSYASVEYTMTHAKAVLMLPRIYKRGTTTIDTVALNQLAIFGRVTSVAELAAIKDGPFWVAGVVMGQAPP